MNRQTFFNSPFLLGFEHLEKLLERTARNAGEGYPPYNIEEPRKMAASPSPWRWRASRRRSSASPWRTTSW